MASDRGLETQMYLLIPLGDWYISIAVSRSSPGLMVAGNWMSAIEEKKQAKSKAHCSYRYVQQ